MLKNIPEIISPELLKILSEMGHGDELIIADGNFPATSCNDRVIRSDGHSVAQMLDAILQLIPLDTAADFNVALMETADGSKPEVWSTFTEIIDRYEGENAAIQEVERFEYYEKAKKAFAVLATTDRALYANVLIKKGTL